MMLGMCMPFSVILEFSSLALRDAGLCKADQYITFPVTMKFEFLLRMTSIGLYSKPLILRRINVPVATCYLM